jgi:hypothetical protein
VRRQTGPDRPGAVKAYAALAFSVVNRFCVAPCMVWARRALGSPNLRFPARAVVCICIVIYAMLRVYQSAVDMALAHHGWV